MIPRSIERQRRRSPPSGDEDVEPIPLSAIQDGAWIPQAATAEELARSLNGLGVLSGLASTLSHSVNNDPRGTYTFENDGDHPSIASYPHPHYGYERSGSAYRAYHGHYQYGYPDTQPVVNSDKQKRLIQEEGQTSNNDYCTTNKRPKQEAESHADPSQFSAHGNLQTGETLNHDHVRNRSASPCISSDSKKFCQNPSLWEQRMSELQDFIAEYGHSVVPHNYEQSAPLAQWTKRQRYQHRLKREGKHSTLSDEREAQLDALGFVWDSHAAKWEERMNDLVEFKKKHGHCNVPITSKDLPQLAIWVKCQRRQYLLQKRTGKPNGMTAERIERLERIGFVWFPKKQP